MQLTSNGQVTGRDIRKAALKAPHFSPLSVETAAIGAQAVTIDEQSDPIYVEVVEDSDGLSNANMDGTPQALASATLTIPTWVDTLYVMGMGYVQITNTSGGDNLLLCSVRVAGLDDGAAAQEIPSPSTGQCVHFEERTISSPGATVLVETYGWLAANKTNISNKTAVWAIALGTR